MRKLLNLAVLVALASAGWYSYTQLGDTTDRKQEPTRQGRFNCRQALAKLAEETACRASVACTLSDEELADMRQREADIAQHCN